MTKQDVVSIVDKTLKQHRFRCPVEPGDIRREGKAWYVTIPSEKPGKNSYRYYFRLADIEEELQDKHNLNVLFVPSKPH